MYVSKEVVSNVKPITNTVHISTTHTHTRVTAVSLVSSSHIQKRIAKRADKLTCALNVYLERSPQFFMLNNIGVTYTNKDFR